VKGRSHLAVSEDLALHARQPREVPERFGFGADLNARKVTLEAEVEPDERDVGVRQLLACCEFECDRPHERLGCMGVADHADRAECLEVDQQRPSFASDNEWVLGCLLADGFNPDTSRYIDEKDVPIVLQTLSAIGFHDARFADTAIVGLSSRRSSDESWTLVSQAPSSLHA